MLAAFVTATIAGILASVAMLASVLVNSLPMAIAATCVAGPSVVVAFVTADQTE